MLYMVYSEWCEDSRAGIVNFVEGQEKAILWAQTYFDQYHTKADSYESFHWQHIACWLVFKINRKCNFHPDEPVFSITNGFGFCFVVPIDGDFDTDELANIKEIEENKDRWEQIIETLIVKNEKELKWRYS